MSSAEAYAEHLSRMVRIATVAEGEPAAFAAFEALLAELYPLLHQRLVKTRVSERGLLFHWPSGHPERNPVVLMAHYDVVPAERADGWTIEPFAGEIRDGAVWGRGTLDDKGPLCVLLEAVEESLAAGVTPSRDLYLSLGGDEESFGDAAREAAALFRREGRVPWLVLDEGGAVVDAVMPPIPVAAAMVGVAEKGIATVELRVSDPGGHASAPERHSAATRLARAIRRLQRRPFPARLLPSTRAMFAELARHASGRGRLLARLIVAWPRPAAALLARLGGEPAALVRSSVAVTMLRAGSAANVLPNRASATLNVRILPGETVSGVLAGLRRRIGDPRVVLRLVDGEDPTPQSPRSGPALGLIRAALQQAYPGVPLVPYLQLSATDARHFHRFAPAVYRFAPLTMTQAQRASIHGVNEHVRIDALAAGVTFYRALIAGIPD